VLSPQWICLLPGLAAAGTFVIAAGQAIRKALGVIKPSATETVTVGGSVAVKAS